MTHFISASCAGVPCGICYRAGVARAATHKVGEEIPHDDPMPRRHNMTQYVCCTHFVAIMGQWAWNACGLSADPFVVPPVDRRSEGHSSPSPWRP